MRRLAFVFAVAAAMAVAGTAVAKQPSKLQTFGTGEATFNGGTLTLDNGAGQYSGVYLKSTSRKARPIASVDFSFDYSGTIAGGAPRFSIPLDTNRNGRLDGYAFLDARNCGNSGTSGNGTVSTEDGNCAVFLNFGNLSFANWDALVAAHRSWRVASGKVPFIIADQPGHYEISNIDLR